MATEQQPGLVQAGTQQADAQNEKFKQTAEYANYFCTYGFLYHQQQMLTDRRRMDAYHRAIMANKECFKDKVVVDVGAGTGVLSIWAAKAGARKVYAIEVTETAKHALKCTAAGGVGDVVKVLQQRVEYVDLSHYRKGPTR